jgi:glycolate oxidase iron-sulfur subunit
MQETADRTLLESARKIVASCDRCGACLPVCPLFGVRDVELAGARGKNAIARALAEGGIGATKDVLAAVDFCLLCRACVDACPNRIKTDEAMIAIRQYLIGETGGRRMYHTAIAEFLRRRGLVNGAGRIISLLRKLPISNLMLRGLLTKEFTRETFLAAFAGPAALGRETPPASANVSAQARVAYFQGCGMQMFFPDAAAETRAILGAATALLSRHNVCCGLPHLAHGMRREFLTLAQENIRLYEDADIIVSDCASCSGMLKRLGFYFDDDPVWGNRAADFSRKVMDLTEYLTSIGYTPRKRLDVTFTYHDPCHLVRGQGIREKPRTLLAATGRFVEMNEADRCCGGAGSFHREYPEISSKILARKRENIMATGAAVVVTACPGCLIQLNRAAQDSGGRFKALHISQVI